MLKLSNLFNEATSDGGFAKRSPWGFAIVPAEIRVSDPLGVTSGLTPDGVVASRPTRSSPVAEESVKSAESPVPLLPWNGTGESPENSFHSHGDGSLGLARVRSRAQRGLDTSRHPVHLDMVFWGSSGRPASLARCLRGYVAALSILLGSSTSAGQFPFVGIAKCGKGQP